jgi:hypothetical protein
VSFEVSSVTAITAEDFESWSTPDDFQWEDVQAHLGRDEDVFLLTEELRRNRRLAELREILEIIEQPFDDSFGNNGNGARVRVGGRFWANLDTELVPELAQGRNDDAQSLVRSPLRSHKKIRPWDLIPHGTLASYVHLCRQHPDGPCDACRAAKAAYERDRRRRHKETNE